MEGGREGRAYLTALHILLHQGLHSLGCPAHGVVSVA